MNKKLLVISSITIGLLMSGCSTGANYSRDTINNSENITTAKDDEILPPLIVTPKPKLEKENHV
ncbi:hypothetical protein [Cytobacillus oceanisediminis]|uniref:hypothetical protein n=1 Tax=Cytobacillus oceanisediminis TaxID=665099 RepID=UPI00203B288C|nr:hypothetical protein [Cytobacillus oceanisediminis]MCM3393295.1 hypothetical protein [Cytobacillus oceanisediminis]